MTETSILPISSGTEPPSGVDSSPEEGGPAGANRRKLLIAGGAAGVVVVAVAAFMLLHGGSPSATTSGAIPHGTTTHAATAPNGKSTGGGKATTKLPRKSKAQAGRDPFKPLFVAPVTSGTAVGGTTVVSPAPSPVASAPVTVPPVTTPPVTPPTSPPTALGSPTFLELLSTNGVKSATFKVGYHHNTFKRFVVLAPTSSSSTGTVFANEFSLLGIQDGQATIQIGDDSPFDLSKRFERRLN